jgi:polyisoprenoid-binding protein YceI
MTATQLEAPRGTRTTWQIDPTHASAEFAVRHLMISTVKGRFGELAGTVSVDESDPSAVTVDATLQVASVDTRQEQRDAHLRSADFFDAERFPTITFTSDRVEFCDGGDLRLIGNLTIRGVTREVVLDVINEGRGRDPWGNERAGFSATAKIDRRDFGLTYNSVLEAGGVAVGNEVKLSIDVELVKRAA